LAQNISADLNSEETLRFTDWMQPLWDSPSQSKFSLGVLVCTLCCTNIDAAMTVPALLLLPCVLQVV
jgi:hypothetical protein